MDYNTLWFLLIGVLFIGYFVLEGFDLGVGILLPILGKDDVRRRVIINTIGPHWDGNEVWLITAGGAMFAAFPNWYATLFSGFYLPLFLILLALIVRGVAFEFRSKDENPTWRATWDWAIFIGSLIPALLWGVAFANIVQGVPIDAKMNYVGGFWNLLNPYALVGGLVSLSSFIFYGALFLSLKTTDDLEKTAYSYALRMWLPVMVILALFVVMGFVFSTVFQNLPAFSITTAILALAALGAAGYFLRVKRCGWAFVFTLLTIALSTASQFLQLFPRVMVSSLKPEWSLTIHNAASSPYTLQIMSIVALIFVPIVLAYQGWTYWVFRKRIKSKPETLHY